MYQPLFKVGDKIRLIPRLRGVRREESFTDSYYCPRNPGFNHNMIEFLSKYPTFTVSSISKVVDEEDDENWRRLSYTWYKLEDDFDGWTWDERWFEKVHKVEFSLPDELFEVTL